MTKRIAFAIVEIDTKEIVAEHFDRCSKFKVYELDDRNKLLKIETYFNPLNGELNGACQIPAYLKQFNVNTIVTGIIEPKTISKFNSFDIEVITAPGIVYEQALELYKNGNLNKPET